MGIIFVRGPFQIFKGPSGHTFQYVRKLKVAVSMKYNKLVSKITAPRGEQIIKGLSGLGLSLGPHFAHTCDRASGTLHAFVVYTESNLFQARLKS